ncbi:hypothetical protein MSAN_01813400 [Mycena sanguinolenta]|uniref:DUF6534 domain-containing protein n=1 Tax=Mycena sanguinolenta TaxID=230812 RepID=A0A8H7CQT0_9AGAR|nr:hypothetical protein MSAN_01813400 [Mycena sanguinolenta]
MEPLASFDPNPTLGAVEIGVLLSYALFGVATTQTYTYFSRFPEDPRRVKALTAFIWACGVVQCFCLGHSLYTFTITDFANLQRLFGSPPKSLSISTLFSGFTAACVHGFFAYRIYAFTKKIYIPALVWLIALVHLVGRLSLFATTLHASSVGSYLVQREWLVTTNWGLSVAADVVIATTMVIVLRQQRSRARARVVDKLILWTIETGLLTSVASIGMLICFVLMKQNYAWLAFYAVSTQLFSNSLMTRQEWDLLW